MVGHWDAFISYSHSADGRLARALQHGLERVLCKWFQRRTFRIFRDRTNLAVNPDAWEAIKSNLERSRWLVLMASPSSAKSYWCGEEIKWWLQQRSLSQIILIVTDGEVIWDRTIGDFNYERSTAIHPDLKGVFTAEPLWLDMRWAVKESRLSWRNAAFRDALITIAAALRGVPKDAIDDHATNVWRRNLQCAIGAILVAFVWWVTDHYLMNTERLLTETRLLARTRPTEALKVMEEIGQRWFADDDLLPIMSDALWSAPLTVWRYQIGDSVSDVAWLSNGQYAAISADGMVRTWSGSGMATAEILPHMSRMSSGSPQETAIPLNRIIVSVDREWIATSDWQGCVRTVSTSVLKSDARLASPTCLKGLPSTLGDMAYGADATLYVVDKEGSLWQLKRGDQAAEKLPMQEVDTLSQCQDGRVIAQTKRGPPYVLRNGMATKQVPFGGEGPWHLSDSCRLVLDARGNLYRADNSHVLLRKNIAVGWPNSEAPVSVAFSPNDEQIAVGSYEGPIRVVNVLDGSTIYLHGHQQRIFSIAFDDSGKRVLSASLDGTVRIFAISQTLATASDPYVGATDIYASINGGALVSAENLYDAMDKSDADVLTVPYLHTRHERKNATEPAPVIRDWKNDGRFYLAVGDEKVVLICSEPQCPDESILRKYKIDMASTGANAQARVSRDGRWIVVIDMQTLRILDAKRSSDDVVLKLDAPEVTSATFDARDHILYTLKNEVLHRLPYGARSISLTMQERVNFCLTARERQDYLHEWALVAHWRADRCAQNK